MAGERGLVAGLVWLKGGAFYAGISFIRETMGNAWGRPEAFNSRTLSGFYLLPVEEGEARISLCQASLVNTSQAE